MYQIKGTLCFDGLSPFERFVYARFAYRNGIDFISDAEYDALERKICYEMPGNPYTLTTYDDDPTPVELLQKIGYTDDDILYYGTQQRAQTVPTDPFLRDKLDEAVSKSCYPYIDFESAYTAMEQVAGKELYIGLKVDGIKTRNLYQKRAGNTMRHVLSLSRARDEGEPINITPNVSRILLPTVSHPALEHRDFLIVNGESFYEKEFIDEVNAKYHISLKTPRSAGMSFLRNTDYDPVDYANLLFWAFKVDYGDTVSEGLDLAEELGFSVVPYMLYRYESKPFKAFQEEFTDIINRMHTLADEEGIPTDGLVVQLNRYDESSALITETKYDGGMFALKIGAWEPGMYTTTVVDIMIEQQTEQCSVKVAVVPTKTQSGITVSVINMYNMEYLITEGVVVGSRIVFKYQNETTPLFVGVIGQDEDPASAIRRAYVASRKDTVTNLFLQHNTEED